MKVYMKVECESSNNLRHFDDLSEYKSSKYRFWTCRFLLRTHQILDAFCPMMEVQYIWKYSRIVHVEQNNSSKEILSWLLRDAKMNPKCRSPIAIKFIWNTRVPNFCYIRVPISNSKKQKLHNTIFFKYPLRLLLGFFARLKYNIC